MKVRISGPPRRRDLPAPDRRLLRRRARRILLDLEQGDAELSITLLDDPEMAELNRSYRDRSGPTDVLSFSLLEGPGARHRRELLGDVVIGVRRAAAQAARRRRDLDDEVARLLVHGVLHLLGHDHEREAEAREMRRCERRLWRRLEL
jgi:probable rRNA maturation factor